MGRTVPIAALIILAVSGGIAAAWFLLYTLVAVTVSLVLIGGGVVNLVRHGRWEAWQPEWAEGFAERFAPPL